MKSNKTETVVVRLSKEQKNRLDESLKLYSKCNKSDVIRLLIDTYLKGLDKMFETKE